MTTHFFSYTEEQQINWIKEAENALDLRDIILEKDIWICWVLKALFSFDLPMVFKGGTSLSKGFNLIHRFSEDLDITLDHRQFMLEANLTLANNSQIKKAQKCLKAELQKQVSQVILPKLQAMASQQFPEKNIVIQLDKEDKKGEKIHFYYPKLLASSEDYLLDKIILEFGIRNVTEPNEKKHITPILSQFMKNNETIEWPTADVDILSPIRTLWEKATLIHVECSRNTLKNNAERLSRHWYDLSLLIHSWVGKEAIPRMDILQSVVHHKKIFYPEKYYDDCLNGHLRLVPENAVGGQL